MTIVSIDHVNIRTRHLSTMIDFYTTILGLEKGWRPGSNSTGAWLYSDDRAIIHLVEVNQAVDSDGRIDHFALNGEDQSAFLKHLAQHDIEPELRKISDAGVQQVNIYDPDGNKIEVVFKLA